MLFCRQPHPAEGRVAVRPAGHAGCTGTLRQWASLLARPADSWPRPVRRWVPAAPVRPRCWTCWPGGRTRARSPGASASMGAIAIASTSDAPAPLSNSLTRCHRSARYAFAGACGAGHTSFADGRPVPGSRSRRMQCRVAPATGCRRSVATGHRRRRPRDAGVAAVAGPDGDGPGRVRTPGRASFPSTSAVWPTPNGCRALRKKVSIALELAAIRNGAGFLVRHIARVVRCRPSCL